MFESIRIVGHGRVGTALSTRLAQRGHQLVEADADLVVLCVPDAAIADVARSIAPGPWIAHTSGATSLGALAPHTKRFGLHPLQSIVLGRGPEQLDGAWAAITGENEEAVTRGNWLAREFGLHPFSLGDELRALVSCGRRDRVELSRDACTPPATQLFERAGAPPEALLPLMQRVIDNGFELTGPITRGDWQTIEAHLAALRQHAPELEPMYRGTRNRDAARTGRAVKPDGVN